ncbi:MAG: hypothetical protein WCO06_05455 [Candidatus Roizmanbacteria bacterium]
MSNFEHILSDPSLVIVFAYAPAGLGHLRVTNALYRGLPEETHPLLLGADDHTVEFIHRMMSNSRLTRSIMTWSQKGWAEKIVAFFYGKLFVEAHLNVLYEQLSAVLEQQIEVPKTVLVIATHFGLAHQLGAIKQKFAKEKNVRIILVLQVTDDSPQALWYVPTADLIFVPSFQTRSDLIRFGKKYHLPEVPIDVISYPVSPRLTEKLSPTNFEEKIHQLEATSRNAVNIVFPISGAAVGLNFYTTLIDTLHQQSRRFKPFVICKTTDYTQNFILDMIDRPNVKLILSKHGREIVQKYEDIYNEYIISLEVTKPSEQAFKSLLRPEDRGGSIILFAEPVGRQEFDNLNFLRRHLLIPQVHDRNELWRVAHQELMTGHDTQLNLRDSIENWRGLELPHHAIEAGTFINWALKKGLLQKMIKHYKKGVSGIHSQETNSHGVHDFWEKVAQFVSK